MATAAAGTARYTGSNPFLKGITWGDKWDLSTGPITWAMGTAKGQKPVTPAETAAFRSVFEVWGSVANLSFKMTSPANSDFEFFLGNSRYFVDVGVDDADESPSLGQQIGPFDEPNPKNDPTLQNGKGYYNREAHGDWAGQLDPGGYAYLTILHELGHGLGLAHPHDDGGSSIVWKGPLARFDDSLYTVMSYNDAGRPWAPNGRSDHGFPGAPMAVDIAAIQMIYGARHKATGNSTYVIPDTDSAKRYYTSIWDTGGTDRIVYNGSKDAVIDLRGATLDRTDPYAGGHLSGLKNGSGDWIKGNGGFTIAKDFGAFKVRIENASGGRGDDVITGNQVANRLLGGRGDDDLSGQEGKDMLIGGSGSDRLLGGAGKDILKGGAGADVFDFDALSDSRAGASRDVVLDFRSGVDVINLSTIDAELDRTGNQRFAWVDADMLDAGFTGEAGELRFDQGILMGDVDGDTRSDFQVKVFGSLTAADIIF